MCTVLLTWTGVNVFLILLRSHGCPAFILRVRSQLRLRSAEHLKFKELTAFKCLGGGGELDETGSGYAAQDPNQERQGCLKEKSLSFSQNLTVFSQIYEYNSSQFLIKRSTWLILPQYLSNIFSNMSRFEQFYRDN